MPRRVAWGAAPGRAAPLEQKSRAPYLRHHHVSRGTARPDTDGERRLRAPPTPATLRHHLFERAWRTAAHVWRGCTSNGGGMATYDFPQQVSMTHQSFQV